MVGAAVPPGTETATADPLPPSAADAGGLGAGFRPNDIFVGFALSALAFFLIFGLGLAIFAAIEDDPSENAEFIGIAIIVFFVDLIALILVPMLVLQGRNPSRLLGLLRPTMPALGWGLGALIASWVSLGLYQVIIDAIDVPALEPVSAIEGDEQFTVLAAVLTGIAVIVMAPIAEEIFHRGFLVGAMARRLGPAGGVVISASIFSALHFDVGSLIPFFIIGVVFGVAYVKSRNLWAPISAHFIFNLVAFIFTVSDRGVS